MSWPTIVYIIVAITLDGAAALVAGLIPERLLAVSPSGTGAQILRHSRRAPLFLRP